MTGRVQILNSPARITFPFRVLLVRGRVAWRVVRANSGEGKNGQPEVNCFRSFTYISIECLSSAQRSKMLLAPFALPAKTCLGGFEDLLIASQGGLARKHLFNRFTSSDQCLRQVFRLLATGLSEVWFATTASADHWSDLAHPLSSTHASRY